MAHGIVVGSPVFARCGGPCMVVADVRGDGWVNVQWFDGGAVLHETFPAEALRSANWFDRLCAALGC